MKQAVILFAWISILAVQTSAAAAYTCVPEDTVDYEKLKPLLTKKSIQDMSAEQRKTLDEIDGELLSCPEQNYNNPKLSAQEKENLKQIYLNERINKFELTIARDLRFINLDNELEFYKRTYHAIYGKDAALPAGVRLIEENQNKYLKDRKEMCSTQNVDTSYMGPVRDQDDMGWCYAYATADLISFHAKKRVSAVDVAILNNNFSKSAIHDRINYSRDVELIYNFRSFFTEHGSSPDALIDETREQLYDSVRKGGITSEAMKVALQKGVCLEKDMPSTFTDTGIPLSQRLQSAVNFQAGVDGRHSCLDHLGMAASIFTNLNREQIEDVARRTSPDFMLFELRQKNCKEKVFLPDKKPLRLNRQNDEQMFSIIDDQLNKKQPVVATYQVNMLQKGRSGVHISGIVGRRFNDKTGRCEYRVRNSWGPHTHFEKSTGVVHDNGYFWVDEINLKKNILQVDALD